MKRRTTALIGALALGGLCAGAACSSSDGQQNNNVGFGGKGQPSRGGAGGSVGLSGSSGAGGSTAGASGSGGGTAGASGSGGAGGGPACAATATTNCTGTMSGAWCVDQFLQSDPVFARFSGIWAAGPTNVWAVGAHTDSIGIFNSDGFIFHWDGCSWTQASVSNVAGLREVWGSAANDVWVVGDQGTALHFNGLSWAPVSTGSAAILWGVSGTAANDVWAVGDAGALHWNGTAWAPSAGFPLPPPEVNFRGDIWAVSPSDVWVVGNRNLLTRFNGSTWSTTTITTDNTHSLFGVWSDGSNAWAVGEGDQIQKFAGGAWSVIQGAGGSSLGFVNVMAAGADVWAVGLSVVHSAGGGPFQMDPDAPAPPYSEFSGLWVTSNQVWAAGSAQPNGTPTIIHRTR